MNTTELIKIAREYCFLRHAAGDETVLLTFKPGQLQQFVQRIEQPHKQRIAELENQIEQLREALQALYDEQNGPPLIRDAAGWEAAMELASKALEGK